MNAIQTVTVNDKPVTVKEYKGQRVVTFKDIDACHGRPDGTARKRFSDNRQHFIENEDYFLVKPSDVQMSEFRTSEINNRGTTLLTESGYLMLAKSFTDDLAWQVQRQLVNCYFRKTEEANTKLLELQIKQERARAMHINAIVRLMKQTGMKYEELNLSPIAVETMRIKAAEEAIGADLGQYLPRTERTYTATELGKEFGCSAHKIGRIANANGLKTGEYGIFVMDKSRSSAKEIPAFRYNEKGRRRIEALLKEEGDVT